MTSFTTQQMADHVGGRLDGPGDLVITGLERIERAAPGQATFIGSARYAEMWAASEATAALVQEGLSVEAGGGRALIRVGDSDLAMAAVLELFAPPPPSPPVGVDGRAVVDSAASLADGVAVGPLCYVGPGASIGAGTVLHPNVTVLADSRIGAGCVLWPGVVVRERCEVGDGCILHPNVTIGSDGFGYRPAADGRSLVKVPQIGTVRLGRGVELGAGTCIDRGKFSATTIGDGTKLDNLCHVAHNCDLGRCVVMAGLSGLGGSVTIGDGAMIGGGVVIKDHVTIGAGGQLGGGSALMHDIPPGEAWHGHPAQNAKATFREFAAIRKLPETLRRMKAAERRAAASGGSG